MMAHDALGAHRRDELGLADDGGSRPVQAAVFLRRRLYLWRDPAGGDRRARAPPLGGHGRAVVAIVLLAILGAIGAKAGGAPQVRAVVRVTALGALAMAATALLGHLLPVGAL